MYKTLIIGLVVLFMFIVVSQAFDKHVEQEGFNIWKKMKKGFKRAGKRMRKGFNDVGRTFKKTFNRTGYDNDNKKKKYNDDLYKEVHRRCRVLTGRDTPHKTQSKLLDGTEALGDSCEEYHRSGCAENKNDAKCQALETQCRLARTCIIRDNHLKDTGRASKASS
jgi:uncharacterized protein YxeA